MNNGNNHNSGFMGGFIFGALFGGIVVFLLATKKGKKLLMMLIEEGGEGISEIEEFLTEDFFEGKPEPVGNNKVATSAEVPQSGTKEKTDKVVPHMITRLGTSGRRFFRGKRPL